MKESGRVPWNVCVCRKMTLVIGRTSVRTVLLTSLLPISVVLVVLARAGDVATLEYSVEPLPASREQRPRPDTGESIEILAFRFNSLSAKSLSRF